MADCGDAIELIDRQQTPHTSGVETSLGTQTSARSLSNSAPRFTGAAARACSPREFERSRLIICVYLCIVEKKKFVNFNMFDSRRELLGESFGVVPLARLAAQVVVGGKNHAIREPNAAFAAFAARLADAVEIGARVVERHRELCLPRLLFGNGAVNCFLCNGENRKKQKKRKRRRFAMARQGDKW